MSYQKDIIQSLNDLDLILKNEKEIIVKAKYGPSKNTRIPLELNEELSCLIAAIIGDGNISKDRFLIRLDGFNKELIENFCLISNNLFLRKFNIGKWMELGKERYCLKINSKAVHAILTKVFSIPAGKKSHIVTVPLYIKNSNNSIKSAFLIGIMVTEGGRRKSGFGLTTASKNLWADLKILFQEIGIETKQDKWINTKYNREYYGISFKKDFLFKITENCKNPWINQILINCKNFKEDY